MGRSLVWQGTKQITRDSNDYHMDFDLGVIGNKHEALGHKVEFNINDGYVTVEHSEGKDVYYTTDEGIHVDQWRVAEVTLEGVDK